MHGKTGISNSLINVLLRPNFVVSFGNQNTQEGVRSDLKKVEAIKQMQPPTNEQYIPS